MEFQFDINDIFKHPITEIDQNLLPPDFSGDRRAMLNTVQKVTQVVNAVGAASAKAQGLPKPITTTDRLRNSDNKLYFMVDKQANNGKGAVTGMLKTGKKALYVFDKEGQHYQVSPKCVLDFYVPESRQRNGLGKQIFQHMLEKEQTSPINMAIDRPSEKLVNFLDKHYSLKEPIKQRNNFVVYNGFFPKENKTATTDSSGKKLTANGLQYANQQYSEPVCKMEKINPNPTPVVPTQPQINPATNQPQYHENVGYVTQSAPNIPQSYGQYQFPQNMQYNQQYANNIHYQQPQYVQNQQVPQAIPQNQQVYQNIQGQASQQNMQQIQSQQYVLQQAQYEPQNQQIILPQVELQNQQVVQNVPHQQMVRNVIQQNHNDQVIHQQMVPQNVPQQIPVEAAQYQQNLPQQVMQNAPQQIEYPNQQMVVPSQQIDPQNQYQEVVYQQTQQTIQPPYEGPNLLPNKPVVEPVSQLQNRPARRMYSTMSTRIPPPYYTDNQSYYTDVPLANTQQQLYFEQPQNIQGQYKPKEALQPSVNVQQQNIPVGQVKSQPVTMAQTIQQYAPVSYSQPNVNVQRSDGQVPVQQQFSQHGYVSPQQVVSNVNTQQGNYGYTMPVQSVQNISQQPQQYVQNVQSQYNVVSPQHSQMQEPQYHQNVVQEQPQENVVLSDNVPQQTKKYTPANGRDPEDLETHQTIPEPEPVQENISEEPKLERSGERTARISKTDIKPVHDEGGLRYGYPVQKPTNQIASFI